MSPAAEITFQEDAPDKDKLNHHGEHASTSTQVHVVSSAQGVRALSYGVFTFDNWSRSMSQQYGFRSYLFDCFSTA